MLNIFLQKRFSIRTQKLKKYTLNKYNEKVFYPNVCTRFYTGTK